MDCIKFVFRYPELDELNSDYFIFVEQKSIIPTALMYLILIFEFLLLIFESAKFWWVFNLRAGGKLKLLINLVLFIY